MQMRNSATACLDLTTICAYYVKVIVPLAGEPEKLGAAAPPILLVHGDADPMIPAERMLAAAAALGRAGASVQWHLSAGLAHSIDETGLALGGNFLAMAFRGLLARPMAEISCSVG